MTTTNVSRLILAHPILGEPGGTALHDAIEAMFKKLGDNMNTRMLAVTGVTNGSTATLEHDFRDAFGDMRYDLYTIASTDPYDLTKISATSSPSLSQFVVAANSGNPTTKVDITNNSGSTQSFLIVLMLDPLYLSEGDIKDIDISTNAPQDGQALVWSASAGKFVPGASGDSSFKLQAVSGTNLTLKGGQLILTDGQIMATYSGSGSVKASFRVDLTLALNTILGGSPANATYYQLAIDRTVAQTETTTTDSKEKLTQIVQGNLVLLTTYPEATDRRRYIPLGWLRSATTGNAWTGTGSDFGTYPVRLENPEEPLPYNLYVHPTLISPNIYATLALALAAASAGDRILVMGGYTITSAETLSLSNVEVKFMPNVVITINGTVKGLIVSGNDNTIDGAKYTSAVSGTIPAGIEVTGNNNNVNRSKVESTGGSTVYTAAYNITGNANEVTGLALQTSGTISANVTDSGTGNEYRVR